MGLIGDDMGKFKLDKVFKEFAAISNRSYVATTIEGEKIYHCTKKSFDEVVKLAKGI